MQNLEVMSGTDTLRQCAGMNMTPTNDIYCRETNVFDYFGSI